MDANEFDLLGKLLDDYLLKQFAPPAGTETVLGFFGAGIAVNPGSFLSNGVVNPLRVSAWLDIAAEPLGAIGGDGRVGSTALTAFTLMDAVCNLSACTASVGSDAQAAFARIKNQAMENLGGAQTLGTAPLDWYDPAHVPQWPKCNLALSASTSGGSSTTVAPPVAPPPRAPLWAWRTLPPVRLAGGGSAHPVAGPLHPAVAAVVRDSALPAPALRPAGAAAVTSLDVSRLVEFASARDRVTLAPAEAARAALLDKASVRARAGQAVLVAKEMSAAANQAATTTVSSTSLTLGLSYQFVQLSRVPWWSDLLLLLTDWYIPGLSQGGLVGAPTPQEAVGVPIALILTDNVLIQATWSASDRSSATTNTHLGPWSISSAQFSATAASGQSTLTIPGIQAIGCIYRLLPKLPPADHP